MLGALFKPAWQSKSATKRKQFIEEINSADVTEINILKQLALADEDLAVRKLAVQKIADPNVVFEIIKKVTDGETRDEAVHVFSKLTGPKSKLTENDFRQLIKSHSETKLSITKTCPYANIRLELLNNLNLEEQIDLLADIEYSDTRVLIAEKIESINLLEKARQVLKGKDKNAEKIVKNKLHKIHAAQKQEEENLEKAETLCDSMEYLAGQTAWRSEFKDRYIQCNRQWNTLDFTPSDYLIQRYTLADEKVALIIKEQETIDKTVKTQNDIVADLISQCEEISELDTELLFTKMDNLNKLLNNKTETWKQSLETVKPEKTLWKHYEGIYRSLDSVTNYLEKLKPLRRDYLLIDEKSNPEKIELLSKQANSLLAHLEWSKDLPKLSLKENSVTELNQLNTLASKLKNNAEEKLDKLHKRINRLQGSTKRGNLAQARRELSAVIKLAEEYTGKDKTTLDERLEKATEAVDKMADWKDYATAPKLIELCEAMEALSPESLKKTNKANMNPDKLASKIAELQKNWKTLGHSDSADEHWERFSKAGDSAYAPCIVFFEKRQETRKKNLEKREPLVKKMQELVSKTDWNNNAECKNAEISIRKIDADWKKVKDVEPGPGTKQWKRLRKAKNAVYEKLDEVYSANLLLKNELVNKAKSLLEAEIKEDTFKKLQQVQGQWKEIGVTKRKDDQKIWKEFKKTTDAVYEKIQNIRKTKRAEEDEQLKPYRDVIKAIQALSKKAKDLADADSNFAKYQNEHDALPSMPRSVPEKVIEGIKKDYQRACREFAKTRERIIQKNKHQALDNLVKKADLCNEYEALAHDASSDDINDLKTQIDALEISDNELRKRFAMRLDAARESNREAYTQARKLLCIHLEILLGKDSPAEDRQQRMQIQLERMQKGGFGQDKVEKSVVLKKLKMDWYCLPGAEPELQKKLDARFKKCLNK